MKSLAILGAAVLVGCGGGDPFTSTELEHPDGSELAGAAGAVSIGSGGSHEPGGSGGKPNAGGAQASGGTLPSADAGQGGEAGEGGTVEPAAVPCVVATWQPSAFASSGKPAETPASAVDGVAATRWSSGASRAAGQWFALELGAGVVLEQLELRTTAYPLDLPDALALELDGKPVAATVSKPAEGVLRLSFKATAASSARLVLTGEALSWWSIGDVAGLCR